MSRSVINLECLKFYPMFRSGNSTTAGDSGEVSGFQRLFPNLQLVYARRVNR